MCLNIDTDFHPEGRSSGAMVATAPILVYKRLGSPDASGGFAPYMGTRWDFGVPKKVARFGYGSGYGGSLYKVEEGLHAFFTKDAYRCRNYVDHEVFPAVIPEGARFYLGECGEIVCTELTVYRNDAECLAAFGATKYGAPVPRTSYKASK